MYNIHTSNLNYQPVLEMQWFMFIAIVDEKLLKS